MSETYDEQQISEAHSHFRRVAGRRKEKVIDNFRTIANIAANPYRYEFTAEEVDEMFREIADAFKRAYTAYKETNYYKSTKSD